MMSGILASWTVRAANLPEHARNPIHTDEGGRAAGFPGALVAGVTVYAYLTRPPAQAWGLEWLRRGTAEVRFASPVFADDELVCAPIEGGLIEARVGGEVRATCVVTKTDDSPVDPMGVGPSLESATFTLSGEWADYGLRVGEDLDLYGREGIGHPALWPAMANSLVHQQLAEGSWIHTRSTIRHLGLADLGTDVFVEANVIRRFETRSGERAVLDVRIGQDGRPIAMIEHEALVRLA